MSRIKRGGARVRAGGGRTRKEDCCCGEPVPCATINDEPTRATWEVSYEIFGLSIGSEACGGACNSVNPLAGVVPYNGGGFSLDWYNEIAICSDYKYFMTAGIRCTGGMVTLEFGLGVADSVTTRWAISWILTVPEASFILGTTFTLPRQSATAATESVCLPTPANGIGTTCDFTVSVA